MTLVTGCNSNEYDNIYSGIIESKQYNISSEISGKIEDVKFDLGDYINKDDIVAIINNELFLLEKKQAESAVEVNNAKLSEVLVGTRNEELKQAQANIESLNASIRAQEKVLAILEKDYTDMQKISKAGGIAEEQLNDLKIKVASSKGELEALKANLSSAEAKRDIVEKGATDESINILKKMVEQAQSTVELYELKLEKCNVKSYYGGKVVLLNVSKGDTVNTGQTLITIQDENDIWVNIYVPEKYIGNIQTGEKVKILSDSYPEGSILGEISFISSSEEFSPRNVETKEEYSKTFFKVKVKIENKENNLKPGMMVDILFNEE
jgi:HlyD family secretion protein